MTALIEHVNGHAPVTSASSWTTPAPAAEQQDTNALPPVEGRLKTAVTTVGVAVAVLGLLGFVNSFHRVDQSAQPSFHGLAWTVPTGIDLGILIFSALDIVLALLKMRISWLRLIPWALTWVTIDLNISNPSGAAPLTGFDKLAHGVLPALWAISVEVGAHVVRKRARLSDAKRMDRVRVSRWLLAPLPTLGLWRRMVLWEERSYPVALEREKTRLLTKTELQDAYGLWWRWRAPRRQRALYRLGALTPTAIAAPQDTTAETTSTGKTSTGPDPVDLDGTTESTSTGEGQSRTTNPTRSTSTGARRSKSTDRTESRSTRAAARDFDALLSEARQVPRWRGAPSVERIRTTLHVGQSKAAELAAALSAEDASATIPDTSTATPINPDTDSTETKEVA